MEEEAVKSTEALLPVASSSSSSAAVNEGTTGGELVAASVIKAADTNEEAVGELEELEEEKEAIKIHLTAKWNGLTFKLTVPDTCTVEALKVRLSELTNVQVKRQKLMGLVKGKLPADDDCLGQLSLGAEKAFIMMGTPEKDIIKEPSEVDMPDVINDFDYDYENGVEEHYKKPENILLLEQYSQKTSITFINPPRKGKRLLVLDLDYTLFDCKSVAENVMEMARPGLHEFLTLMYENYDMVVWSQTSWKWLEMKITSLGMLTHPNYKICFVLDRTSMFKIQSRDSDGNPWAHEVKALGIIWSKLPDLFSPANSIHLDDLGRNFAMNPQSGFKIKPFKNAHVSRATDIELLHVGRYLKAISQHEPDFRVLDHKKWKKYLSKLAKK